MSRLRRFWRWVRFGTLREVTKAVDGGCVSEFEVRGRFDVLVGYWAYGHYDPKLPYRGEL